MANSLHFKSIHKKHNNVWNNKAYSSIAVNSKKEEKIWRFQDLFGTLKLSSICISWILTWRYNWYHSPYYFVEHKEIHDTKYFI